MKKSVLTKMKTAYFGLHEKNHQPNRLMVVEESNMIEKRREGVNIEENQNSKFLWKKGMTVKEIKARVKNQKAEFIAMAQKGVAKPSVKTELGRKLRQYLSDDAQFKKEIDKFPEWISVFKKAENKRETIIEIALDKEQPKPKCNSPLGRLLHASTTKSNKQYKPVSDKIIRSIRPEWFDTTAINAAKEAAEEITQKLTEIALSNSDRPHKSTELGKALERRLKRNKKFYNFIKTNRPDWLKIYPSWEELLKQVASNKFPRTMRGYWGNKKYNWPSDPKSKYKQFRNWRMFWANVRKIEKESVSA